MRCMRGSHAEVVDVFCGVGGLSAGFKRRGFKILAGIDLDASCEYAYKKNLKAKFIADDVSSFGAERVAALFSGKKHRVIVGCAPCQPFSLYSRRYRKDPEVHAKDQRWQLLGDFARLIRSVEPDVVSMENVPRVVHHTAFVDFVTQLEETGYTVSHFKVRAEHYGVPQRRTRLVLFASKLGRIEMIEATHLDKPATVRDAIGRLPQIKAGEAHPRDRLHKSRGLGATNLQRLQATKEGGSWKHWSEELQLECHKRPGGKSFRAVYGRMKWDEPSPVITTQCLGIGNGRFGHPEQDRAISIREAALLQSFPAEFEFVDPNDEVFGVTLARQIGNAVPVKLAEAIAESISRHLKGRHNS